ncbi:MAG: AIR synthase-related protein [Candidatus Methanomethylicia archaeon]
MSKYAMFGVDANKSGVNVFKSIIENLYRFSFTPIIRNPLDSSYGFVMHVDGVGSKPIVSYIYWRETGDMKWFKSLAYDAVAMNIDDIVCVGAIPICLVDYVSLNKSIVPREKLLEAIRNGFIEVLNTLKDLNVNIVLAGGETADLPDQVRTLDLSATILGIVKLERVVTCENIMDGDVIIGLRSGGRIKYESMENSGIMCNGVTLARHSLLKNDYLVKYPEIGRGIGYYGRYRIDEYLDEVGMTIGEAILSPSRIYTPIILKILEKEEANVKALIHNTGGGLTKCLNVGFNIHYVKNNLPDPDPIFHVIQRESREDWYYMYRDFNMGIGFEVVCSAEATDNIIDICEGFGLEAQVIGKCEKARGSNMVTIHSRYGRFRYGGV